MPKRLALALALACLVAAVVFPSGALSLDFSLHPNNKSRTLTAIWAIGDIEKGDVEKLKAFLSQTPKKRTQLSIWLVGVETSTRAPGSDYSSRNDE